MEITQARLNQIFDYHPDGYFVWKSKPHKMANRVNVGHIAQKKIGGGYFGVQIDKKVYYIHKLVFFVFNGFWPPEVDHIDGDPSNNKIENLRAVNRSQNMMNQKINTLNTSGVKGVTFNKSQNKWDAYIKINQKTIHLGRFDNLFSAAIARKEAEQKYFGEFARKVTK